MLRTTQLHDYHAAHAKLTEFAGYEMPLWYTTTTDEHMAVRSASGIFDVSHMARFEVKGERSTGFLEGLVPTSVGSQPPGKAFYTLLLNDRGGIIDDLIVEKLAADRYMVVVNAANAQTDMVHMMDHAPAGLAFQDVTETTAMVAVQGPAASASLQPLTDLDLNQLKRFRCAEAKVAGEEALVSRTGYTGEDGFEIMLPPGKAAVFWQALTHKGVTPCGLGARDTLRLEAAMNLYGADMDETTTPLESGLGWTIAWGPADRAFIGRAALEAQRDAGPKRKFVGLLLEDKGVLRSHQKVIVAGAGEGEITSGGFSPTLERSIALARVPAAAGGTVQVDIRGRLCRARVVKPPFVRNGEVLVK